MNWDEFKAEQATLRRSVKTTDPATYETGNPDNQNAEYTAVYEDGEELTSMCSFNPGEKLVFDIEDNENAPQIGIVDSFVTLQNGQVLRAADGVRFEY